MGTKHSTGRSTLVNHTPGNLKSWRVWLGPVLTLVAAGVIYGLLLFASYRLPTSGSVFLLIVAYAAYLGGFPSGLVSCGLTVLFFALEFVTPLGSLNSVGDNAFRLILICILAPVTVLVVARLKTRAEQTQAEKLKLEQDYSVELRAFVEKQKKSEEEVRRLNGELEERVRERTLQIEKGEEASRKQQQQLQAILDYSSATIYLKDMEGRYLVANPRIAELLGMKQAEILGKKPSELLPDGNHAQWTSNDNQVLLTGQSLEVEEHIEKPDGWHTFLSIKFPVRDENGEMYALGGISTDISDRVQLEREAQKFVSLVENSNDFIAICNMEGELEFLNEAGLKLIGLESLEQVKAKPINELYFSEAAKIPEIAPSMAAVNLAPAHKKGELQIRHFPSGTKIPVFSNIFVIKDNKTGRPLGIAHVASDLREYKQAQEAVNASRAYLSGIIEASMDAVITVNEARKIVAFNPAAENLLGWSASEVMGHTPDRFIPEWRLTEYLAIFSRPPDFNEEKGSKKFLRPLYALRADKKEIPIEATISRVKVDGEIFTTVFIRDITESLEAINLLEERVSQRTNELSVLLQISQNVAADFTLQSVKNLLADQLNKLMRFKTFVLYRLQKDGNLSVIGEQTAVSEAVLQDFTSRLPELSPLYLEASKTKTPIIIDDFAAKASPQLAQYLEGFNVNVATHRATMFIPLIVKEETVGLFVVGCDEPGYYTSYHAQLAQAIGYQVAVAIENVRLYEQAQNLAALEERQRLARELHDSTSQVLYSLQLGLRALGNFIQRSQFGEATETVAYLVGLAKGGLDEMRLLIFELRPESLENEGLLRALQKQTGVLESRHGLKVKTHFSREIEPNLPLEYKEGIYRIAREALHNAVKHSNTEQIDLTLDWDADFMLLAIQDYGQGFNLKRDFPGHYGLKSMEERVRKLTGGQLRIESEPGQGTKISLKVPLP